jgi:hypothetical protein
LVIEAIEEDGATSLARYIPAADIGPHMIEYGKAAFCVAVRVDGELRHKRNGDFCRERLTTVASVRRHMQRHNHR